MPALRRAGLAGAVVVFAVLASGCWLRALLGGVATDDLGYYVDLYFAAFGANSNAAACEVEERRDEAGTFNTVECEYLFETEEGPFAEVVSTSQIISVFGLFGVIIDPLILQVPQGTAVTNATFNPGLGAADLVVTDTTSFMVQPGLEVQAEPGHKFLILEFPDHVANNITATDAAEGPEFDFDLQLDLPTGPALTLKAMFTVKVEIEDEKYYLPMLPCTTDFAAIPGISIPQSIAPQSLLAEIEALASATEDMACDGQVYDLRPVDEPGDPGGEEPPELERRLVVPGLAANP